MTEYSDTRERTLRWLERRADANDEADAAGWVLVVEVDGRVLHGVYGPVAERAHACAIAALWEAELNAFDVEASAIDPYRVTVRPLFTAEGLPGA